MLKLFSDYIPLTKHIEHILFSIDLLSLSLFESITFKVFSLFLFYRYGISCVCRNLRICEFAVAPACDWVSAQLQADNNFANFSQCTPALATLLKISHFTTPPLSVFYVNVSLGNPYCLVHLIVGKMFQTFCCHLYTSLSAHKFKLSSVEKR